MYRGQHWRNPWLSPETALLPGGKLAYGEERGKALSDGGYPPPSRLLPGPGAWVPQSAASVEGSGAINLRNNIHGLFHKHVVRIAVIIFHHFAILPPLNQLKQGHHSLGSGHTAFPTNWRRR